MQMHSKLLGSGMNPMSSPETMAAWARLLRAQQGVLAAIQTELKLRGFPPLAWYEALLELSRAANGKLRPHDLEKAMLLPQYSTSRLLDRLVRAELVVREACAVDRRGQVIALTARGRALQQEMWGACAAAIARHVAARLSTQEAAQLGELLAKLT
jgi:DNA-binding MarR family transcriptional regulator